MEILHFAHSWQVELVGAALMLLGGALQFHSLGRHEKAVACIRKELKEEEPLSLGGEKFQEFDEGEMKMACAPALQPRSAKCTKVPWPWEGLEWRLVEDKPEKEE